MRVEVMGCEVRSQDEDKRLGGSSTEVHPRLAGPRSPDKLRNTAQCYMLSMGYYGTLRWRQERDRESGPDYRTTLSLGRPQSLLTPANCMTIESGALLGMHCSPYIDSGLKNLQI